MGTSNQYAHQDTGEDREQRTQKNDECAMIYDEWAIEKRPGNTYSKGKNNRENQHYRKPLIRKATNYNEHGNHRTKRAKKMLLQEEEDMN